MSDGLDIGQGVTVPLDEVELRASRSGGPGGQHANVTASRVEAIFEVRASAALPPALRDRIAARLGPRITAVAQESRGQARNRVIALERLRARLADAAAPRKQRRPTKPGRAARERRLAAKRRQSERKRQRRRPSDDYG
ncbi:MAG TPA: alternative ribosome rescue aminoacyl-tRNA hydrolase ArfB [Solirubrobacterales bacterium]|nr:alternative ribosome rescue aminoacyl-tRNA hydrolase ArfB [Solirubrobacterales bacterium]